MKNLTKHLLHKGTDIGRQNVVWDIAGSFVYALASMVLSFLVIRAVGDDQGSVLSSGSSTLGQQIFIVIYLGIRPFQIANRTGEYLSGGYLEHRSIACIMALGAGAVFLISMHGMGRCTTDKCMILTLLVIYRIVDGYADVYESEFQRQENLYLAGESNFFRTSLPVSAFLVTLTTFEHLLLSRLVTAVAQAAGIALFNLDIIHTLPSVDWNKEERKMGRLSKSTSFLFVSALLNSYVFSAAKYAIDARLNDAASGYFNLTFIPTFAIYMVANFVTGPLLTRPTDLRTGKDYDCFGKEFRRVDTIILGLTVLVMGATVVLGKWVLSVMKTILGSGYEGRLVSYYEASIIIVLGGGFYALANLMYHALVIIRRQKAIFTAYLVAAVATAVLSGFLVSKFGINGVAGCYLLLMMGLVAGFGLYTAGACQGEKKESTGSGGSNT